VSDEETVSEHYAYVWDAISDTPAEALNMQMRSELMVALFGEAGKHARSAVGVAVLPLGAVVEIDAIVAVRG